MSALPVWVHVLGAVLAALLTACSAPFIAEAWPVIRSRLQGGRLPARRPRRNIWIGLWGTLALALAFQVVAVLPSPSKFL
jgi:hypothetical protein